MTTLPVQITSTRRGGTAALLAALLGGLALLQTGCSESLCRDVQLIGHRGSRALAPENTMPAFLNAMQNGGDGVELDLKVTADNVLVAFHDSRVGRITGDPEDRKISDLTFAEVQSLDAGKWFSDRYAGTRIPSFEEVVITLQEQFAGAIFVLDIKDARAPALLEEFLSEEFMQTWSLKLDQFIFASFRKDELLDVYIRFKGAQQLYFTRDTDQYETAVKYRFKYVRVPHSEQSDDGVVDDANDLKLVPVISSTYLSYDVGIAFVNNMVNGMKRKKERRPEECTKLQPN